MSRDRYELGDLLGKGHFTVGVYRAIHKDLGRAVAIKLLELRHPDHRDYLLAEGSRMAQLPSNENIVEVIDSGDWDDDHVYLAVELCEEGSLEELCTAGPVDPQRVCRLVSDSCRGLHALHQAGMIHLDIRPGNIMLSGGTPKIGDFGLARPGDEARLGSFYSQHAAPELITSQTGTVQTDQYAMAMTLGHLLSDGDFCGGQLPTPVDPKSWKQRPDMSRLGPHVPERLRKVIKKATSFDPNDRFADAETFKRALDKATPAVAFLPDGTKRITSVDGAITISWSEKSSGHEVEIQINGRRRNADGRRGVSPAEAKRHVASLVTAYAYP